VQGVDRGNKIKVGKRLQVSVFWVTMIWLETGFDGTVLRFMLMDDVFLYHGGESMSPTIHIQIRTSEYVDETRQDSVRTVTPKGYCCYI
jgi:hypothetical protein